MISRNTPKLLLLIAGISLLGLTQCSQNDHTQSWLPAPEPLADSLLKAFQEQKSSIGTTQDPQARQRWEWMMLRDPKTGEIPANIRQRELAYAVKLPIAKETDPRFRKAETNWQAAGPYNLAGRTRALALDKRNEQIILAGGVSGGMWRSTDGGQNWNKTTDPQQLHSVTCLVQDVRPGQENTWYYGTGELIGNSARGGRSPYRGDGIYKSTDNGQSWQVLATTATNTPQAFDQPFDYVTNLKINPVNTTVQELYAAAFGGIYKSVNGGLNWVESKVDNAAMYTDVEVTPTGIVYASLSTVTSDSVENSQPGIYRSTNGGLDWQNIIPPTWPSDWGRVVITTNPQDPNEVFFLGDIPDGNPILWRYRHNAGGWTDLSANLPEDNEPVGGLDLQDGYNMVVKVHPQQSQTIFVGGTNLFRSRDGFTSNNAIDWIGGYDPANNIDEYPNQHPDQHLLIFYPSNPAKAIAAHDGGLSLTDNILGNAANAERKVDWTSLNRGYVTTQYYTVGLDQSQVNNMILGGMQDNGSWLIANATAPGKNWSRLLGGDGGYTHVATRGSYYYVSFQKSQIYRLTLNSEYKLTSFARLDPPDAGLVKEQPYLFINPYVFDPTNKSRMYLAAGDVVYRNRNVSQIPSGNQQTTSFNWTRLEDTAISDGSISAIAISSVPADILYYGTSKGEVFKATSANSEPVVSQITDLDFPDEGYVSNITINPADANEIVIVFSNYSVRSIFHSTDGGKTFSDISGNLEEFPDGSGSGPSVRHVEILPLTTGGSIYLAGTSTGLYSTRALNGADTDWQQESPEMIGRVVVPQLRHRSLDGRVVVATHGNGVYYKNFDNVQNTYIDPEGKPLALLPPYPNPFSVKNGEVIIPFNLPKEGIVRVRVYSSNGQLIKLLFYNKEFAGTSEVVWDGRNVSGTPMPPGMYIVRFEFEDQQLSSKVILLR